MIQLKYQLSKDFELLLEDCDEIWFAVAMISDNGLDFIENKINTKAKQNYLVGIGLPTPPSVLKRIGISNTSNVNAKVYYKNGVLFHPKVYLIKSNDKLTVFIGSGNCTEGGFGNNVEVSVKTDDAELCQKILEWFNIQYNLSVKITKELIEDYEAIFLKRKQRIEEDRKELNDLFKAKAKLAPLNEIDFTNQYFKKSNYEIFSKTFAIDESEKANSERQNVKRLLFRLHDKLKIKIKQEKWDIHEHYYPEHIVSSDKHGERTGEELTGMWLHYGRDKKEIKDYGEHETPLDYMRLQVIINETHVGVWNRIGKNSGSRIDRDNLKHILKNDAIKAKSICETIMALPENYFIHLNNETLYINKIRGSDELIDILLEEKFSNYFIIGSEYSPNDARISEENILDTIFKDLKNLYPLYELIKHKM